MNRDRRSVDPDDRYPAAGLTRVERVALEVLAVLPDSSFERTRDVFQFDHGGERGLVVVAASEAVGG